MTKAIEFIQTTNNESKNVIEVDFSSFLTDGIVIKEEPIPSSNITSTTSNSSTSSKKSRKKRETITMSDGSEMVPVDKPDNELPLYQTNEPYIDTYNETNNLLRTTIHQIDAISSEIKMDLDTVRNSKTLKNKYTYIPNLVNTLGSLMNTKVTAIREMNKVMTDAHNLELKRIKDLNLANAAKEVDDEKYIMDLYNAFISAPVNAPPPPYIPPVNELSMQTGVSGIVRTGIGETDYLGYVNNLSPVQNAMRYESNPDVKTVVVYDQATGRRWFDVMNLRTGESVPNVPRPDPMFLEDTTLDLNNRIARNTNLDKTYPIVLVGESNIMQHY